VISAAKIASMMETKGPNFGLARGSLRTWPGGAENWHIFDIVSRLKPKTRALTTALTLDKNDTSDRGIVVHGVHPLSPQWYAAFGQKRSGR
jgi:hypothetical protein